MRGQGSLQRTDICVTLLLGKACAQGTNPSQGNHRVFLVQPWTSSFPVVKNWGLQISLF